MSASDNSNSIQQEFAPLKNDRLLRALRFESIDTTPVWMMRQAGRYLPEYKATRAEAGDFMSCAKIRTAPLKLLYSHYAVMI